MRHLLPPLLAFTLLVAGTTETWAQVGLPQTMGQRAAMSHGRVDGIVVDQSGASLGGVSVLALGSALAMVRTDLKGRFSLVLPPGQYVLRATREGYVSTYREPVRIQSDVALRRSITLVRAGSTAEAAAQPTADALGTLPGDGVVTGGDHAHTEAAWRLRHLPRTVLRDTAAPVALGESLQEADFLRRTPVDWLVHSSARAASSFLMHTDFNGQVDLLATSAWPATGGPGVPDWGRGVAYVVLGAPVGSRGDWSVRAALGSGERAAWALQGEYQARADQRHAIRTGVSYSIQSEATHVPGRTSLATVGGTRRVGGVYTYDRWSPTPHVTIDYGAKLDRYDYLPDPTLVSGQLGLRVTVDPRLALVFEASPRMAAPGADQFLPPVRAGAWLPPERTFTALGNGPLRPERVEHLSVGFDAALSERVVLTFRTFSEDTRDQIATLFGLDEASQSGHYYVATSGDVNVDGIVFGADVRLLPVLRGRVAYTHTAGEWNPGPGRRRLARIAPALARPAREIGHDVTTTIEATVPQTATHLRLAYRFNTLFSERGPGLHEPSDDGRFNVEIRQQLPYRPLGGGDLNLLVSARTLLRDLGQDGSYYDELMTLAPPLRIICGIQMRF